VWRHASVDPCTPPYRQERYSDGQENTLAFSNFHEANWNHLSHAALGPIGLVQRSAMQAFVSWPFLEFET